MVAPTLHLGDAERELVLATSSLERYGAGEIVLRAGVRPDHIRFIVSGHASLMVEAAGGRIQFGVAELGDYIGQTALTRERALSTAAAADLLTVLVVPLATLDTPFGSRPLLASEIGSSIELKRKAASEALATAGVARGLLTPWLISGRSAVADLGRAAATDPAGTAAGSPWDRPAGDSPARSAAGTRDRVAAERVPGAGGPYGPWRCPGNTAVLT